ncbi:helix-turn-helix transcriptional regulator [Bacillus sp. CCB-MMP212]|uniref:helix-turn-helix domain-containing protein n=1 Tax=Bacillus TaxID=1386 RepID=UPI000BFCBF30|nr:MULTISPECIES: helix-turn-helix transcriptional regulator [Bacillus]MCI4247652.1 helix-turn-helix transcriptional regulator [Bacillus sp. CCB-MMP212]MED2871143.1 helix-turn-helix transcriptional regulator [Bacillus thuringiensis]PGU95936.1 hypothetical protein COD69_24895 [Bacillus thuringiensis]
MECYIDIQGLLDKHRINLAELSRRTGIERSNLTRMRTNKVATLGSIGKIARAFGIQDINEIVKLKQ